MGQIQNFDLRQFYRTSQLAAGLGPDSEDVLAQSPEAARQTLQTVQLDTLAAIARQDNLQTTLSNTDPEGLCTLDARGSDTTLSANCIGTGVDDPLTDFEDLREDGTIPDDLDDETFDDDSPFDGQQNDDLIPDGQDDAEITDDIPSVTGGQTDNQTNNPNNLN